MSNDFGKKIGWLDKQGPINNEKGDGIKVVLLQQGINNQHNSLMRSRYLYQPIRRWHPLVPLQQWPPIMPLHLLHWWDTRCYTQKKDHLQPIGMAMSGLALSAKTTSKKVTEYADWDVDMCSMHRVTTNTNSPRSMNGPHAQTAEAMENLKRSGILSGHVHLPLIHRGNQTC